MKTWTVLQMVKEEPCYSKEKIQALWGKRKRLTLKQIFELQIRISHKLWIAELQSALDPMIRGEWAHVCSCEHTDAISFMFAADQRGAGFYIVERTKQYCALYDILGFPRGTPEEEIECYGYS